MLVKASTSRLVQHVRRAYVASYNETLEITAALAGTKEMGFNTYVFLVYLFYLLIVGAQGYCYTCNTKTPTLGRAPLGEGLARRRDIYLTTLTKERQPCRQWDSKPKCQQPSGPRPKRKVARPSGMEIRKIYN